jgi:hypothetical protein
MSWQGSSRQDDFNVTHRAVFVNENHYQQRMLPIVMQTGYPIISPNQDPRMQTCMIGYKIRTIHSPGAYTTTHVRSQAHESITDTQSGPRPRRLRPAVCHATAPCFIHQACVYRPRPRRAAGRRLPGRVRQWRYRHQGHQCLSRHHRQRLRQAAADDHHAADHGVDHPGHPQAAQRLLARQDQRADHRHPDGDHGRRRGNRHPDGQAVRPDGRRPDLERAEVARGVYSRASCRPPRTSRCRR